MTKRLLTIPTLSLLPWSLRGELVSQTERAEAFQQNLDTQFWPLTDPWVPSVIEMVDVALRSYIMTPAGEPKLTNPEEVQEAIRNLKVSKAPSSNDIPNRAWKHFPQRAVSLLVQIFNASLLIHHFPTISSTLVWSLYSNRGWIHHCPHSIGHFYLGHEW